MARLRLNASEGTTRLSRGLRPGMTWVSQRLRPVMGRLNRKLRSEPGGVQVEEKSRVITHTQRQREEAGSERSRLGATGRWPKWNEAPFKGKECTIPGGGGHEGQEDRLV